ncbi:MAG: hypothetical protein ACFB11_20790 [Paracoccaceae bacterium]
MVNAVQITDEEITAYLDGEADADSVTVLEAALRSDPDLSHRIQELSAVSLDDIQEAMAPLLAAAPPFQGLDPKVATNPAQVVPLLRPAQAETQGTQGPGALGRRRVLQLAASVACVSVGAGGYAALQEPRVKSWADYAAAYHRLYSARTLAMVMTDEAQQSGQLVTISAALGTEIELAALQQAGMRFVRGQLLSFNGRPIAHLAFMAEHEAPVALCIFPAAGQARSPTEDFRFGVSVLAWSSDAFEAVLLGEAPEAARALVSII